MTKETAIKILTLLRESGEISEETYLNAHLWLTGPEYKKYADDVLAMVRPTQLIDSFYAVIPFGTGGRRGTVGVGTNRINERTIGESAQGLAQYIIDTDQNGKSAKRGVAIAYDVRPHSLVFARLTASVMAANGIKTHLFEGPRSTPELSFAVRHLGCISGVVLTASHNPPTDNGFKAYWEDGGQIVAPHDVEIMKRVMSVKKIKTASFAKAKKSGLIRMIGKEVDDAYFACVKSDLILCAERQARIAYSPLHGTGVTLVPRALSEIGFRDVQMPPDQVRMDGSFPTVPNNYPNPEMPDAMTRAVEFGKSIGADIVMASDPDSDRLGVFAPDGKGNYLNLSGNVHGALLCHFTLSRLKESGTMPSKPFVMTTLVSTLLAKAICKSFKVEIIDDLLVGFKHMAEVLAAREAEGRIGGFVYTFEESIGFLRGTFVRDKDAGAAAVTSAQMVAWLKARGKTVFDYLDEIYTKYGYFAESQFSVFLRGADGMDKMAHIMKELRENPPVRVGNLTVHAVIDRKAGTLINPATGKKKRIDGTKGDVIQLWFDDLGKIRLTVRPSGTEPKIKHYAAAYAPVPSPKELGEAKSKGDAVVAELISAMKELESKITG